MHEFTEKQAGGYGKAIYPSATFEDMYTFEDWVQVQYAPCELEPSAGMSSAGIMSNAEDFDSGKPLKTLPVMMLFGDMKTFKKMQTAFWQPNEYAVTEWKERKADPNDFVWQRDIRSPYVFRYRAEEEYVDQSTGYVWRWKMKYAKTMENYTWEVPAKSIRYMGGDATVFLQVKITKDFYTDKEQYAWNTKTWTYVFPIQCVKDEPAGGFTVRSEKLLECMDTVRALHGLGDEDTPHPEGHSTDGSAGLFGAAIWLDFNGWGVFGMNSEMDY